jgi:hypothetical protein
MDGKKILQYVQFRVRERPSAGKLELVVRKVKEELTIEVRYELFCFLVVVLLVRLSITGFVIATERNLFAHDF